MKFGKTLAERTLKEWRFYYVDYKELKQCINKTKDGSISDEEANFDALLDNSEEKLRKFYQDKFGWAKTYIPTLENRVSDLRESASEPGSPASPSSISSDGSLFDDDGLLSSSSPTGIADNLKLQLDKLTINERGHESDGAYLKEAYRRMGASKHFQDFIYAKKSLVTFQREIGKFLFFH